MIKRDSFEATIKQQLTLPELQELAKTLEIKLTRAKYSSVPNVELEEELERKLLTVRNQISALKVRS